MLSQYDPFRCLSVSVTGTSIICNSGMFCRRFMFYPVLFLIALLLQVIVPLLVTEDEKTLVTCINCLTKVTNIYFQSAALDLFWFLFCWSEYKF